MLRKLAKGSQASGGSARRSAPLSIIGADVRIVGNILTEGEMQIDGQLDGDITCNRLVVGESARLTGEVRADSIRIHGRVDGRIIANSVTVARTAEIVGDITHETLEIEAGGRLEGHLIRKGTPAPTPALAPPSPTADAVADNDDGDDNAMTAEAAQ